MQTIKSTTPGSSFRADVFDVQPNGVQHALVQAGPVEVARLTRRTLTGWSIWIQQGPRRGMIRDLDGEVVYADSVEEALWILEDRTL